MGDENLSQHTFCLQASEQHTYADIEAAYKCLEESYGSKQEDVILYGQSVGSGPTLDLAARLPRLRAVVLHSPILSGVRVMYPVKRTYWFDIYKVKKIHFCMFSLYIYIYMPHLLLLLKLSFLSSSFVMMQNIDKIPLVNCPVLIIHVSCLHSLLETVLVYIEGSDLSI